MDSYNLLTRKNSNQSLFLTLNLVVTLRLRPDIDKMNSYIDVYGSVYCHDKMKRVLKQIRKGFNSGLVPKLTDDGTSGTYKIRDENKEIVAIFKPIDEEPFAPNNPRGH